MGDSSMDVDYDAPAHSPVSSSLPPIPQALVDMFKTGMIGHSNRAGWSGRLISAGSNKASLQDLLYRVLSSYSGIVSETALRTNVIALRPEAIDEFIEGLDDDEVEDWKRLVQNGDWERLLTMRMYIPRFRTMYCNLVLAQRNFRT